MPTYRLRVTDRTGAIITENPLYMSRGSAMQLYRSERDTRGPDYTVTLIPADPAEDTVSGQGTKGVSER